MEILSVTPNGIEQGKENAVTIKGDGFVEGAIVSISGTAVIVENTVFVDASSITTTFTVAPDAPIGPRDVSVVLPDATMATLGGSLFVTNFQSLTAQLRLLTGERIRSGKSDSDTRFTDSELIDIIIRHAGNLYLAAAEVWSAKAADAAELVDISESGSERKLSQIFKQFSAMSDTYQKAGEEVGSNLITPAIPQSVDWLYGKNRPGLTTNVANDPFEDPFAFLFSNAFRYVSRPWYPLTVFNPAMP